MNAKEFGLDPLTPQRALQGSELIKLDFRNSSDISMMHALDKLEAESGQRADSIGPSESDKT